MFENPSRGRQARNFTTNVQKILDLKSSSEQMFFRKLSLGAPESLFIFRFSEGSARARERWAAKPRDARNEGGSPRKKRRESCLSRLAPLVTRVVICVSRAFCSTDQEKREIACSLLTLKLKLYFELWIGLGETLWVTFIVYCSTVTCTLTSTCDQWPAFCTCH